MEEEKKGREKIVKLVCFRHQCSHCRLRSGAVFGMLGWSTIRMFRANDFVSRQLFGIMHVRGRVSTDITGSSDIAAGHTATAVLL